MTNGANYKRGKLHHSPWHSDIHTSNQLNTPRGWLSRPFPTKTVNKRVEEPIKQCGSARNEGAQSINLLSDDIPDAISISNSDTFPAIISKRTEAISEAIPNCNPEAIPDVVGKRLPPLQSHAIEWVRDWVRVIAALHHAIDKVE